MSLPSDRAAAAFLARVRHDLVKRLCWPARDRRDAGGAAALGELRPTFIDDEGRAIDARRLWANLVNDGDVKDHVAALAAFSTALDAAIAAADAGDVDGVLALESAFMRLAQTLRGA